MRFHKKRKGAIAAIGGTALRVYVYLLAKNEEVGVRELQRALGFKSPSTAKHHLDRLVEIGLAIRGQNGYKAITTRDALLSTTLMVFNNVIPFEIFLGTYGVLTIIFFEIFLREAVNQITIFPLLLACLILSGAALYRGVSLYKWYNDLIRGEDSDKDE